jgi:prepilin-type N-terminal cleavage/methylation domain-containing protein
MVPSQLTNPSRLVHHLSGYTLVELMVASSLLGLAVTGVMSMLGTARSAEAQGSLRQQAATLASSALEDTLYHYTRYPLPVAASAPQVNILRLGTGPEDTIHATIIRTVGAIDNTVTWYDYKNPTVADVQVPFQKVTAKIKWSLIGHSDSIEITKRVARVVN